MMRPPILQVAVFRDHALDPDEHERSRGVMLYLLDALVAIDRLWLQQYPETPWLYESGVRYVYKDPVEAAAWQDIPNTLAKGYGDCKDFAAWRVAELLERVGVDATPAIQWRLVDGSWRLHALVELSDGSLEDPSKMLGMGSDQPFRRNVVPLPNVTEVRGMKASSKAKAILAGLVSPRELDRVNATKAYRVVQSGAENGHPECEEILGLLRQGAAAYRAASVRGIASPPRRPLPAPAGKKPTAGHSAVQKVQVKLRALVSRVARVKSTGAATKAKLSAALRGDVGPTALNQATGGVFQFTPAGTSPAVNSSIDAALAAIDAQMNQLQAQYQQLLSQDSQLQSAISQVGNQFATGPLTSMGQTLINFAYQLDQTVQANAADVSAQIDAQNAQLDQLNQQLQQLQTQQSTYQGGVAQAQQLEYDLANPPPPQAPYAPAPSYAPDFGMPPPPAPMDFGPPAQFTDASDTYDDDGEELDQGGGDGDISADDMLGYYELVGDDDTANKVGMVVESVAPGVGAFESFIPGIGPFLAPLTTDAVKQAGQLLQAADKGDKRAVNAVANTAAKAKAGDKDAAAQMDAISAVHKARGAVKNALKPALSWWPSDLYRRGVGGPGATVH